MDVAQSVGLALVTRKTAVFHRLCWSITVGVWKRGARQIRSWWLVAKLPAGNWYLTVSSMGGAARGAPTPACRCVFLGTLAVALAGQPSRRLFVLQYLLSLLASLVGFLPVCPDRLSGAPVWPSGAPVWLVGRGHRSLFSQAFFLVSVSLLAFLARPVPALPRSTTTCSTAWRSSLVPSGLTLAFLRRTRRSLDSSQGPALTILRRTRRSRWLRTVVQFIGSAAGLAGKRRLAARYRVEMRRKWRQVIMRKTRAGRDHF